MEEYLDLVPEPKANSFNKKAGLPREFIAHLGEVFIGGMEDDGSLPDLNMDDVIQRNDTHTG